jgi:uncharacterized protein DUF6916
MSTSRRSFLKNGAVIALAAGVPTAAAKNAVAETLISSPIASTLNKKDFLATLNSEFVIESAGNRIKTRLVDISDLPRPKNAGDKEGFSLLFRGSRAHSLQQNTYTIEHGKLGRFSFLLVPAPHEDKSNKYYVATINRLFP